MNTKIFKSFRNFAGVAFLMAGCGGGEPIPVNLATAAGPCDYGKEFVTEGMQMVMRDGHVTVEPKDDGQVQATWVGYKPPKNPTTQAGCDGCH